MRGLTVRRLQHIFQRFDLQPYIVEDDFIFGISFQNALEIVLFFGPWDGDEKFVNLRKVGRNIWLARRILVQLNVQLDQLNSALAKIEEKLVLRNINKSLLCLNFLSFFPSFLFFQYSNLAKTGFKVLFTIHWKSKPGSVRN